MGYVAVEKQHVAGLCRNRLEIEGPHFLGGPWGPFTPDQPRLARAGCHFQAAIFDRRWIDGDQRRDEQGGIGRPPSLLILMRFESSAARHLEIDLLLEERRRFAQ